MEQPLSNYNLKNITPYVENFSSAPEAAENPLLKPPAVDQACCVSYFENYYLYNCTQAYVPNNIYIHDSASCISYDKSDLDPYPSEREKVSVVYGNDAATDFCACKKEYPWATSPYGFSSYVFQCDAENLPKVNFNNGILVYPGCTVKITASGKMFPVHLYSYYFYALVIEHDSEVSCNTGYVCDYSPSSITWDIPSGLEPDYSSASTTCYIETFGNRKYRYTFESFTKNFDSEQSRDVCCPGDLLMTPSDWEPWPGAECSSDFPTTNFCLASQGTDCTQSGNFSYYYNNNCSVTAYCGYPARYSCDQTLKSVDGLSVTYTNKTNYVSNLVLSINDSYNYYYYYYNYYYYNLCFSQASINYTVEVLSGGCTAA